MKANVILTSRSGATTFTDTIKKHEKYLAKNYPHYAESTVSRNSFIVPCKEQACGARLQQAGKDSKAPRVLEDQEKLASLREIYHHDGKVEDWIAL